MTGALDPNAANDTTYGCGLGRAHLVFEEGVVIDKHELRKDPIRTDLRKITELRSVGSEINYHILVTDLAPTVEETDAFAAKGIPGNPVVLNVWNKGRKHRVVVSEEVASLYSRSGPKPKADIVPLHKLESLGLTLDDLACGNGGRIVFVPTPEALAIASESGVASAYSAFIESAENIHERLVGILKYVPSIDVYQTPQQKQEGNQHRLAYSLLTYFLVDHVPEGETLISFLEKNKSVETIIGAINTSNLTALCVQTIKGNSADIAEIFGSEIHIALFDRIAEVYPTPEEYANALARESVCLKRQWNQTAMGTYHS
jgi:hypothetical protein